MFRTSSSTGRADRPYQKPNRAARACLRCRTHKIRCDGHSKLGGDSYSECSPCVTSKEPCSYVDSLGQLNRSQRKYIETLEERITKLEALLEKLHPGETFPELDGDKDGTTQSYFVELNVVQEPATLQMVKDQRCYGKFSNPRFIMTVVDSKLKERGLEWEGLLTRLREKTRTEMSWDQMPAWQHQVLYQDTIHRLIFPPNDLMISLIDNYFSFEHIFKPILHRPTFDNMVRARLHEKDKYFGALVLMVCACGARWSDDPRTRKSTDDVDSAGWAYYDQVHHLPRPMNEPVTLVRLQLFNLMLVFLQGTCLISLEWSLIGMGLRLAMDIGVHMNESFANSSPSERELWKRAFWGLFVADQMISAALGRKSAIPPEDVDIDLPFEVDDEYWHPADGTQAFIQPADKPSYISSFNAHIQLMHLMPKVTQLTKDGPSNEPSKSRQALETLAELDSSLNLWLESLPPHLKWNADHAHPIHFAQSAMLHAMYQEKVILIHRPFILSLDDNSNIAERTTDLAICTNAARACCHVLYTFASRIQRGGGPWVFLTAFNAGVILLLDIWSGGKDGALQAIRECLGAVAICEERYTVARISRALFQELLSVTDFSPDTKPMPSLANGSTQQIIQAPADPWWMEGFADNLPSSDYLVFPPAALSPDLYSIDSLPLTQDGETTLLQDWAKQHVAARWNFWDFLPEDLGGQDH